MELVVKFPASSGQLKSNEPLYLYFPQLAILLAAKYYDIVLFVKHNRTDAVLVMSCLSIMEYIVFTKLFLGLIILFAVSRVPSARQR